MLSKNEALALDKYYTKTHVARQCYEIMRKFAPENALYIEPSAGGGAFIDAIGDDDDIIGFDIFPEHPAVATLDFISGDIIDALPDTAKGRKLVAIGNPPFGKKAKLAIEFVNRSLEKFGMAGFIVPVQFQKWSVQSHIQPFASLIVDELLPAESFEVLGKTYSVRCCFQIWSINHPDLPDLRIQSRPATAHPDFEMWQFNRTTEAEKFFDYDWDFAVPRQGYQDYGFKARHKDECDRKKQWIFFKAKSPEVLSRLEALDFANLSLKNTGIPGFGKADVVFEYEKYCAALNQDG